MNPSEAGVTAADPQPTGSLGRYLIYRKLSEGGMGELFLATRDGHPCVLKTLRANLAYDPVVLARFEREALVGTRIRHPNIAKVERFGREDGVLCIEMELVRGRDLRAMTADLLRADRLLPYPVSVTAVCDLLSGLEHVHRLTDEHHVPLNIVHRDLSLRNLMLGFDGTARIVDFGVARATIDDFRTQPGAVVGTVRFLSPELARGEVVDHRSDVYSMGCVLYELLTGAAVVPSNSNRLAMMRAVVEDEPARPEQVNPDIPQDLATVVMRGIEKDRAQRWQTAGDFRDALRACAPQWAGLSTSKMGMFLETWFRDDARAVNELVAAIEARSARNAALEAAELDDLTMVRPMSGFDEVEERISDRTGLVFPARSKVSRSVPRAMTLPTPVERLVVSDAGAPSPIARRGRWSLAAGATVIGTLVGLLVYVTSRQPLVEPSPRVVETPAPLPVTAVQASPIGAREAAAPPPKTPALRTPPPSRPAVSKPAVASEPPSPAPPRPDSKLAATLARLERSTAQPISKDPAFSDFVDEATAAAARLPEAERRSVMGQLDLFIDTGDVSRARAIMRRLEAR
ncbi:MAG: serine/threonine-protein kinase [Myxococcota bacterium]